MVLLLNYPDPLIMVRINVILFTKIKAPFRLWCNEWTVIPVHSAKKAGMGIPVDISGYAFHRCSVDDQLSLLLVHRLKLYVLSDPVWKPVSFLCYNYT